MGISREIREGTPEDFLRELIARLKPTADSGEILEKRISEIKEVIINKLGEFGAPLAAEWPKGESGVNSVIPISMHDITKIDAVINIRVALYDDLQYPNKLTN